MSVAVSIFAVDDEIDLLLLLFDLRAVLRFYHEIDFLTVKIGLSVGVCDCSRHRLEIQVIVAIRCVNFVNDHIYPFYRNAIFEVYCYIRWSSDY